MDVRTETKRIRKGWSAYFHHKLKKWANKIVDKTLKEPAAREEVMYSLSGVFAFSVKYRDVSVRLIKEGDVFRLMKNTEKSDILLTISLEDSATLKDVADGELNELRAFADGRLSYRGQSKAFNAIMRVVRAGEPQIEA